MCVCVVCCVLCVCKTYFSWRKGWYFDLDLISSQYRFRGDVLSCTAHTQTCQKRPCYGH